LKKNTAALISISKPPLGLALAAKYHLPADGFFYMAAGQVF